MFVKSIMRLSYDEGMVRAGKITSSVYTDNKVNSCSPFLTENVHLLISDSVSVRVNPFFYRSSNFNPYPNSLS